MYDVRCTMYEWKILHPASRIPHPASCIPHPASSQGFVDLEDFIERVQPPLEQLILLIRAGAFRFTGKPKTLLLWEAHMLSHDSRATTHVSPATTHVSRATCHVSRLPGLFPAEAKKFELPALEQNSVEEVYDEIELLGWPVSHSYFELLETSFRGEIMAGEMMGKLGKKVRMLGLLVTIKYVRTVKKEWMHFGTFIDFEGQFFDTVHFPQAVEKYPFRGEGVYLVMGKIVEEFGFPSLQVEKMAKMPLKKDPRS